MPNNINIDSSITGPSGPIGDGWENNNENGQLWKAIDEYRNRIIGIEEKIIESQSKADLRENKNIESLGLFVALFTFISVEFSLFKSITDFTAAISFTLIFAGLLMGFVLILHVIIRSSKSNWWQTLILYIILIPLIIALILAGIANLPFH